MTIPEKTTLVTHRRDKTMRRPFCQWIEPNRITASSFISCEWNQQGIWVDFVYSGDTDRWEEYCGCYAELYEDGTPNEMCWSEAKECAKRLSETYHVPVIRRKK